METLASNLVNKFRTNNLTPQDGVDLCELLITLGPGNS